MVEWFWGRLEFERRIELVGKVGWFDAEDVDGSNFERRMSGVDITDAGELVIAGSVQQRNRRPCTRQQALATCLVLLEMLAQ